MKLDLAAVCLTGAALIGGIVVVYRNPWLIAWFGLIALTIGVIKYDRVKNGPM